MTTSLGPDFARRLERLAIRVRRAFAGRLQGERRSTKRGVSIEFADFREYVAGDDPRHLDWNAAARMDRLYLKLFVEEEDLSVHFLVDVSASMDCGTPSKLDCARQITAALAYVSLASLDRVTVRPFAAGVGDALGPERGKAAIWKLLRFLDGLKPGGAGTLTASVREFVAQGARRGPVFVVSDLLEPSGWEGAIALLRSAGYQPMVIHVLSPEELSPPDADDVRFVDAESGAEVEVSLTRSVARAYAARVEAFRSGAASWCRRRDVPYAFTRSDADLEEFVIRGLRTLFLQS
ncbi:MAG: DUF58 domain-containing protein [Candidatus Brocadiae bacterium]|nr:DUF58 domain-containing protein [Candidatus Brocadiia bacterium]